MTDSETTTASVSVAQDFSRYPFGRSIELHGQNSGEAFRERVLREKLRRFGRLKIILDGADGYSSSFLEEAFGGLVRLLHWTARDFRTHIVLVSENDPSLITEIDQYVAEAAKADQR